MTMVPASIRSNNPGAMWGGNRISRRWGETKDVVLHDGESNHLAYFPSTVNGAAAQFDLWRVGYVGLTLQQAIHKWSGGNSSAAYIEFLKMHAGIGEDEVITKQLLSGPKGIDLMKAQAAWEAGGPYPMTDQEWKKAQELVFAGIPAVVKHSTTVGGTIATGTVIAHASGSGPLIQAAIFIGVGLAVAGFVYLNERSKK